jgi:hypothetical protein
MVWKWVTRLPGIGCLVILGIIVLGVLMAERNMNKNEVNSRPSSVSQPRGVTLAQYNQLREGMTYTQVVNILGREGVEISSSNVGNIRTVMYKWEGTGSIGANMSAMFQNGKLMSKAQYGLQ